MVCGLFVCFHGFEYVIWNDTASGTAHEHSCVSPHSRSTYYIFFWGNVLCHCCGHYYIALLVITNYMWTFMALIRHVPFFSEIIQEKSSKAIERSFSYPPHPVCKCWETGKDKREWNHHISSFRFQKYWLLTQKEYLWRILLSESEVSWGVSNNLTRDTSTRRKFCRPWIHTKVFF